MSNDTSFSWNSSDEDAARRQRTLRTEPWLRMFVVDRPRRHNQQHCKQRPCKSNPHGQINVLLHVPHQKGNQLQVMLDRFISVIAACRTYRGNGQDDRRYSLGQTLTFEILPSRQTRLTETGGVVRHLRSRLREGPVFGRSHHPY